MSMAKRQSKATPADYAAVHFEPVLGLAESLGSRMEWLAKMGDRYPTMWVAASTLRLTVAEVTAMAAAQPDATAEMIKCITNLKEKLEAERQVVETASIRLLAGCCKAGLL